MRAVVFFPKKKIFLFLLLFLSLSGLRIFPGQDSKIKIVTTVFPLLEFSKAVGGERAEASLLLPPGAEIHTWRPRPSDMVRVSAADVFIYIGAELEPWVPDLLKSINNPELEIWEASAAFDLLKTSSGPHPGHNHKMYDPHIWLDFAIDQMIVDKIASLLSEIEPSHASLFRKNADTYKAKLQALDQKYKQGLKECVHRTFVLGGHSAFGYLAHRYNLHQISLYGLSPNSEPTSKQLIQVVKMAKQHDIKVIYFEIYISDKLARVIAEEVGARTLALNPGANFTRQQLESGTTFFDIMEKNLENLRDGLICQ
ncbi:MAG: metal ABC transporter solute-binding protein, Zn/Mn family [Candidatus Aminicenantes bacterium]